MKTFTVAGCIALSLLTAIHAAPPESDKGQPAAVEAPRLRFVGWGGKDGKADPKEMYFQIDGGPSKLTEFLKLGDVVNKTDFKLVKFEYKTRVNAKGVEGDVSELTLIDTKTKKPLVLIFGK